MGMEPMNGKMGDLIKVYKLPFNLKVNGSKV
jgi:hypothetical protein